ncbi:MAG: sigma 54-interacting transcriptional regulator [Desulfobacterales bacterium]|nr:sigma 54-interacting transcriptional regulator [Desulfobacterales bacterium]
MKTMTTPPIERIEEISLLYEISTALNEHLDLKRSLYKVLDILSSAMHMVRGTITLLDPLRNEINIEVAHGISRSAIERVRYKLGEGVTGQVIETGKAVAIPRIGDEPRFLDRTASRRKKEDRDLSFFCVPIKKGSQVIGALSVDRPHDGSYSLDGGKRLLSVIATMIASHVIKLETIRVEHERLRDENRRLQGELKGKYSITNIIGSSNRMREVYQMVSQVCRSNATVLIRGESGTGKELVANSIHYNSTRAANPFIKVNCASLPANLIESELFGHEKGSFTGAVKQKIGKFEMAHRGTIFLDEIGSIDLEVQANLLRILQEKEFDRVGGQRTIKVDVRVITATNKNLEQAVEDGTFRGDLYYRLNVFPIYMPPLRERKTDILLLADYFLEKYPALLHTCDRHADAVSLAGERARARELHRAGRAALRGGGHPQLPPAADPSDRQGVRHPAGALAGGGRRQPGAGDDHRRPQEHAGQHHQRRQDPADHRAQVRLQGPATQDRLPHLSHLKGPGVNSPS